MRLLDAGIRASRDFTSILVNFDNHDLVNNGLSIRNQMPMIFREFAYEGQIPPLHRSLDAA